MYRKDQQFGQMRSSLTFRARALDCVSEVSLFSLLDNGGKKDEPMGCGAAVMSNEFDMESEWIGAQPKTRRRQKCAPSKMQNVDEWSRAGDRDSRTRSTIYSQNSVITHVAVWVSSRPACRGSPTARWKVTSAFEFFNETARISWVKRHRNHN
jgi:hypothetical protein